MVQEESPRPDELSVPFSEFDPLMAIEVLGKLWTFMPQGGGLTPKGLDTPIFWDIEKTSPDLLSKEGVVRVQAKGGTKVQLLSPNRRTVAGIQSASEVVFNFRDRSIIFRNNEGDSYTISNAGTRHEIVNQGQEPQVFEFPIGHIYG
ncbi:MAG: hypothetical protein HY427_00230 [Candidatus Levybacteria bacterium]|nr:hypothetical protein [Candidatus Levybacteria bacterium]